MCVFKTEASDQNLSNSSVSVSVSHWGTRRVGEVHRDMVGAGGRGGWGIAGEVGGERATGGEDARSRVPRGHEEG